MANSSPDIAVRDEENVERVVKERQRHFDQLRANVTGVPVEEIAQQGLRLVTCEAYPVKIIDVKDSSIKI